MIETIDFPDLNKLYLGLSVCQSCQFAVFLRGMISDVPTAQAFHDPVWKVMLLQKVVLAHAFWVIISILCLQSKTR